MEGLIQGVKEKDFLMGVLLNIEDHMPKAKRKRVTNIRIIQDYILRRTLVGGRSSAFEQCQLLGIEADAYTFYKK